MSKLNKQSVAAIRASLLAGQTPRKVAGDYGVTIGAIEQIRRGVTWKEGAVVIPRVLRQKLTREQAGEIRRLMGEGVGRSELARRFGVSVQTVRLIEAGVLHRTG